VKKGYLTEDPVARMKFATVKLEEVALASIGLAQ
jgi:hypothetical protein